MLLSEIISVCGNGPGLSRLALSRNLKFGKGEGSSYIAISWLFRAKKDLNQGKKYPQWAIAFSKARG